MRSDAGGRLIQLLWTPQMVGEAAQANGKRAAWPYWGFMGDGGSCTGPKAHAEDHYPTSSRSNVLPNSKWCLSKMEDPWSLASGFWDLSGRERERHTESINMEWPR